MKILYSAIDQHVPGTVGGSTHVRAVAEGLSRLGNDVHVLTTLAGRLDDSHGVRWHSLRPPFGARHLRLLRSGEVLAAARDIRPHVIMERYYNFGGESVRAAKTLGAPLVLEVNAPVVDHPGSAKRLVDRALLVEPMRRWRDWQCAAADLIVTPRASIVPGWVPRQKVLEIEWGADTERFHPGAAAPLVFTRRPGHMTVIFAGAFRRWHGAIQLVEAIRLLRARGREIDAVLIGNGPEWAHVREAARGLKGVTVPGAIPYEDVPAQMAAADAGAAPFDTGSHAPLALDFYWSPLKIFEYMASGLPVVTPAIPRLSEIVRHEQEGLLYDPPNAGGLADALERLTVPELRRRLGAAARERVATEFGWDVHCRKLDEAFRRCVS